MFEPNEVPRNAVSVLVADDTAIIRRSIKRLLEDQPNIKLLGEAEDFPQVLEMSRILKPDVILLDLHMPGSDGFESAFIKSRLAFCGARILAMSVSGAEDDESRDLAAHFGATELLDKAKFHEILISAILRA